ncbi:ATP-binding protein [Vibrio navarrensis]|uniref:histidine kinase n=1 Tax=Vibrio navarrensis TaxID=29495 RepID=A0A099LMS8_9VIBR|nr:ATP-binding protein [Vibrio navarrensis]KGK08632.1 histidine kinase [Vibrio navarrensis]MBE4615249.1 ATP-binding protein [Vibrio navarrensis]QOD71098.1 GHKL domain-containing protein [Vibrio navarrensis]
MPAKLDLLKSLSLKRRLFFASFLWVSSMLLAAGVGIPTLVKEYLVSDIKGQLQLAMDEIAANLEANAQGNLLLPARLSDPRFSQPYSGLYWNATLGEQTLRSRSLWDRNIQTKATPLGQRLIGAKEENLIAIEQRLYLPEFSTPITIVIGIDETPVKETLRQLTKQLWMILGLLLFGVMSVIGMQIAWSFRPLNKLQQELKALKSGQQDQLQESYPAEVAPLIKDLNALLFHYQELLQRARHHAGNLSHSLKTPLSVLKNEISQLNESERQRLLPSLQQIQNHIDYHLSRARMAGAMNILSVKSNPSQRVDAIAMAFDKVYAEREIVLVNELDDELDVAVEQSDLDEMLGNLLENSYKWGKSFIRIYAIRQKNTIDIVIEDDGPGIDEKHLERVTHRGVRLDETTAGTGLGLNIVSEMAHSYRGQLTLEKSQLGGLKAILSLKSA